MTPPTEAGLVEHPRLQPLVDALVASGGDRALLLRFMDHPLGRRRLLEAADRWAATEASPPLSDF